MDVHVELEQARRALIEFSRRQVSPGRRGPSSESVGDRLTRPQLEEFRLLRDNERRARVAVKAESSR